MMLQTTWKTMNSVLLFRRFTARLTAEIARSNGMLNNEKFISKAPEAKVNEEKEKLKKYEQMMEEVSAHLEKLMK